MRRFIGIGLFLLVIAFVLAIGPVILEEYRFQQRPVPYDYINQE